MASINSIQFHPSLLLVSEHSLLCLSRQHEKKSCSCSGFSLPDLNQFALSMISKVFYFEHLYPSSDHTRLKVFGNCRVVAVTIDESDIPALCISSSDGSSDFYSIAELSIAEAKNM